MGDSSQSLNNISVGAQDVGDVATEVAGRTLVPVYTANGTPDGSGFAIDYDNLSDFPEQPLSLDLTWHYLNGSTAGSGYPAERTEQVNNSDAFFIGLQDKPAVNMPSDYYILKKNTSNAFEWAENKDLNYVTAVSAGNTQRVKPESEVYTDLSTKVKRSGQGSSESASQIADRYIALSSTVPNSSNNEVAVLKNPANTQQLVTEVLDWNRPSFFVGEIDSNQNTLDDSTVAHTSKNNSGMQDTKSRPDYGHTITSTDTKTPRNDFITRKLAHTKREIIDSSTRISQNLLNEASNTYQAGNVLKVKGYRETEWAGNYTIDSTLSTSSSNAVETGPVKTLYDTKMNLATNDSGTNTGTDKYYFKYDSGGNTWVTESSLNLQEPEPAGTTNTTFSSTITNDSVTSAAIKTKLESMPQVDTKKGHYTDKMLRKGSNGFEIVEESIDTIGGLVSGNLEYPLDQDLTLPSGVNLVQYSSKDVSYDFRKSKRVKKTGSSSSTNFSNAKIVTKDEQYMNEYFDKTNIQPSLSPHIGDHESCGIMWRIPSTPNMLRSASGSFSSYPNPALGRTMAVRVKRKSINPTQNGWLIPDGSVCFSTPGYSGYFDFHVEGSTPTLQFKMYNLRSHLIDSNMKVDLSNNNLTDWNFMAVAVWMEHGLMNVRCCINGENIISRTGITHANAPVGSAGGSGWGDIKFFLGYGTTSGTPDYTATGGTGGAWFVTDTATYGSNSVASDRNAGHLFRNKWAGSRNVDLVSHAGFWDYALSEDELKSLYCDGNVTCGDAWNSAIYKFPSQHVTDLKVYSGYIYQSLYKFYEPRSIGLPRQFLEDRGRIKVGQTVGITICAYASNGREAEEPWFPYTGTSNITYMHESNGYPGNSGDSSNPLEGIATLITTPGNALAIGTRAGSNGSFTNTRTDRSTTLTDANKFYTVWYGGLNGARGGQVNGTTVGTFAYNDDATIKFEPIQHSAAFYVVTADYTHADGGKGVLNINFYANGVKQGNTLTLGASNNSPVEVAAKLQTVGYNLDGTWGYYTSHNSRSYTRGEFIIGSSNWTADSEPLYDGYNWQRPRTRISKCGIWDRALTASEIAELGVLGFNDPAKTAWVDSVYSYDVNGSSCDDDIEFGKETLTLHSGEPAAHPQGGVHRYAKNHVGRKNLVFHYHHKKAPADFGTGIVTDIGPYGNHGKLYYSNDSNGITDEGDHLWFTGNSASSNYIKLFNWATIYDGEGQHSNPDITGHFRNEVTFIMKYMPRWNTGDTYSAIMSDSVGGFFIGKDSGDDYLQVQIGGTSDGGGSWSGGSHNLGHSYVPPNLTDIYVFIVSMKRDHDGNLRGRTSFNGSTMYTWISNSSTLPENYWESTTLQIGQELGQRAFKGKIYEVAILNRGIGQHEVDYIYNTFINNGVLFESDEYQVDNRMSCFQKTATVFKHTDNKIDNVKGLQMTASNQIHLPKFALPTNFVVEFVAEVKTGTEYSQGMSDTYKNYHTTIGDGDILKFKDGDEEFKISRKRSKTTNSISKALTVIHKGFDFTSSGDVFDGFKHITVSTNPVADVFSVTWTQRYAKQANTSSYDSLYHNWQKVVTTGDSETTSLNSYVAGGYIFRNAATWANNNDPVTGQSMSNYFPVYAPTLYNTGYHWWPFWGQTAEVATITFSHDVRLFGSYGYEYNHTFIDSTWTYAPGSWWTAWHGGNHSAYFYYKDFDAGTYNLPAHPYFCYLRPGTTSTVHHHRVDIKVNGISQTRSLDAPKELASTTNIAANSGIRYLNPGCMYMNFTKLAVYETSTTTNLSSLGTTLYNSYKKTDPHNIIDSTNYDALTPISGSREIFKHSVGYGNDTTELIGIKNNNGTKITNTFNSPEKTFYTKIHNSDLILKSKEDSNYGLKYSSGSFYVINNGQEELLNVNGGTSASDDRIKYSESEIAGDQIIDRLSQLTFKKYLKTAKIYPELEEKASQMTKTEFKKYLDSQKIKYTTEIGLIAQELQQNENYRHLVRNTTSTDNSPYEVKYNDIITQAICGIKHLNSELEEVTRKTDEMMSHIS